MLRFSLPLPSEGKLVDRIDRHSPLAGGGYSLSSTSISNPRPAYDLSELRVVTLTRLLDPSKQICQFEVPGGGVCRDTSCEDLHLSRVDVSRLEPSDDDVAGYLCSIAPIPSRDKALSAVQDARLKDPNASLETRFARVMELLCPEPE
ncbi:hypothetical protein BKA70DRAFT_288835 [Coprinopsis sp. MPI-PUGE-AT-0042]|nr:hypothetical protein BKA70DRAFT_288835 [Coprinopsis sp. MPI-PUGE-AT-0042]